MIATILILIMLGIIIYVWIDMHNVVIYEYEKGLMFRNGIYVKTLDAGKYFVFSKYVSIKKVGTRSRIVNMPVQEVLSVDGVTLKVSTAMEYEIVDPYKAVVSTENYDQAIYTIVHSILREIVGQYKIEEVLEVRSQMNDVLLEKARNKAELFGIQFNSIVVRDITFPGELKKIFTQVIQAKKEGLAVLEKARAESAALRSLANAAKMTESNPNLLKLKLLQTTGNTLVVGLDEKWSQVNKDTKK